MKPLVARAKECCTYFFVFVLCMGSLALAQNKGEIHGIITEASTGEAIISANVMITGTTRGTVSNIVGDYRIDQITPGAYTIDVKILGYKNAKKSVVVASGAVTELNFTLQQDILQTDEVIITGTAGLPTSKLRLGNAISVISEKELAMAPVRTVTQLFDARTSGIQIWNSSGLAGTTAQIQLRGVGNLNGNSAPLIYVDGVRMNSSNTNASGTIDGKDGQSVSSLNFINPADIDRVEILKGASAATLYGSDAANGVIQIFTKSGANAQTPLSFDVWSESRTTDWSIYDSKLSRAAEDYVRAGSGLGYTQHMNVRGKGDRYNFYGALTNRTDNTGFKASNNDNFDIKGNFNYTPDEVSTFKFGVTYTKDYVSRPDADNTSQNTSGWMSQLMKIDSAGVDADFKNPYTGIQFYRQSVYDKMHNEYNSRRYSGNFAYSRKLPLGIELETKFGYEDISGDQVRWFEQGFVTNVNGTRSRDFRQVNAYNFTATLAKQFSLADEIDLAASVGTDYYRTSSLLSNITSGTFDPGFDAVAQFGAQTTFSEFEQKSVFATGSLFTQGQFSLYNRTFVTLGLRADKSSSFGGDADPRLYPKVSASYLLPVEGMASWLTTAKLRGSYGVAGKQPDPGAAELAFRRDAFLVGSSSTIIQRPGESTLKPSLTNEVEGGFELSFLEGRVGTEVTYYVQNTTNDLFNVRTAPSEGYGGREQTFNLGQIRTTGIEASVFATTQVTEWLTWDTRINASKVDNEVIDDGGYPFTAGPFKATPMVRVEKGFRVGELFSPVMVVNQYGTASLSADSKRFGGVTPSFTGNFVNTVNAFSRVSLTVNVAWATDFWIWNLTRANMHRNGIFDDDFTQEMMTQGVAASKVAEKSRTADQIAALIAYNRQTQSQSEAFFEKGDFIKIREVSVSYRLPEAWPVVDMFTGITVTASATNLMTWTEYKGFDPEVSVGGSSLLNRGADNRSIPSPRLFMLRASFQF